ncbi:hypothetical protein JCM1840_000193 [Sporobolomyces johnsonii]
MPTSAQLRQLAHVLLFHAQLEQLEDNSDDEGDSDYYLHLACAIWGRSLQVRRQERTSSPPPPRLLPIPISKSLEHRDRMLAQDNDRWFRDSFRMSRTTFCQLVALLSRDPDHLDDPDSRNPFLFNTSGTGRPAAAVEIQFGTFLRFASKLTHISSARDTAVGKGSAYNYIHTIVAALLALQKRYLRLPLTLAEKKEVSDGFGLSSCLGTIDGSLFKLKNEPKGTGGAYYCRKKFYGINLLAACDSRGRFIAYEAGWPASVVDATVMSSSSLWRER